MTVAKVFLSHHSDDKPLVEAVATALGLRGIIPWLDIHQLVIGTSLHEQLHTAIEEQIAVALFLSAKAVDSYWVQQELRHALALEAHQASNKDWILPIYLGEPRTLVQSCTLLANAWWDADGNTVNRLGIQVEPPTYRNRAMVAENIADRLARAIYTLLARPRKGADNSTVNLVIDQRGRGWRRGADALPTRVGLEDAPTLVFRPDMGERNCADTLVGSAWEDFRNLLRISLSTALPPPGTLKKVRIFGDFQFGYRLLPGPDV